MKGAKPSIKERALGQGKQWIPGASFAPARVPWVQLISSLNQLQEVAVWRVWSSLLKNFSETKIQSPKSCRMRVSRHCVMSFPIPEEHFPTVGSEALEMLMPTPCYPAWHRPGPKSQSADLLGVLCLVWAETGADGTQSSQSSPVNVSLSFTGKCVAREMLIIYC